MNNKIKIEIAIGIILIIAIITGGLFWLISKNQIPPLVNPVQNQTIQTQTQKTEDNNPANNIQNTSVASTPVIFKDDKVDWYKQPRLITTPTLFKGKATDLSIKAWEVGAMKSNGEKIIFVAIDAHDPGGVAGYLFVTDTDTNSDEQRLQPYERYSSQNFLEAFDINEIDDSVIKSDFVDGINSLEYPGFLNFNNMTLRYEEDKIFSLEDPFFYPEKYSSIYKKIYSDKIYGDVFQNTEDGGFYLKSPIGTAKVYSLKVDFFDGNVPQISWNDGAKTQDSFTYRGVEGCGGDKYADDVSNQVSINELRVAGKTNTGDVIYEYKDKNTEYLKKWYQENVDFIKNTEMEDENFTKNTTYEEFVKKHLVFFWKDPLGRLIRFVNTNYVFGGGCGKPVIYLYPQQTEKVSVKVAPAGGMTVSAPAYNQGWEVIADPQSNLTNLADGKKYPYLFWEGRGNSIYETPQRGFVTTQENLENTLNEKLTQLGLIQKEINDFKEFWLPKMLAENKPYYFITFVPRRVIDTLAPLKINPKPDTIIRVLMDYKGMDNYEEIPELKITTPQRKGFTAVEWGGILK